MNYLYNISWSYFSYSNLFFSIYFDISIPKFSFVKYVALILLIVSSVERYFDYVTYKERAPSLAFLTSSNEILIESSIFFIFVFNSVFKA